jgi:hypothetical protein
MDYLPVTMIPDVIMASSYKCIDDDEKAEMDSLLRQASAYEGQRVVVKVRVREGNAHTSSNDMVHTEEVRTYPLLIPFSR